MFRGLIRLVLVALVVVAAAFFLFGYWSSGRLESAPTLTEIKTPTVDTAAARQAGAEIGEKTAVAASRKVFVGAPPFETTVPPTVSRSTNATE